MSPGGNSKAHSTVGHKTVNSTIVVGLVVVVGGGAIVAVVAVVAVVAAALFDHLLMRGV